MEPSFSPAWFATFGRPDEAVTEKRVEGNRLLRSLGYPDGTRDEFEWRLYEPEEIAELGVAAGLRLERADGAGSPRRLLVFERS